MLAPDRKKLQNVYISLPYIMAARTAGIDKNDEITSLSTYVYYCPKLGQMLTDLQNSFAIALGKML